MTTIYIFENFDDQPTETIARITRSTEMECVATFDEKYGPNDYSWSYAGIGDSRLAPEV